MELGGAGRAFAADVLHLLLMLLSAAHALHGRCPASLPATPPHLVAASCCAGGRAGPRQGDPQRPDQRLLHRRHHAHHPGALSALWLCCAWGAAFSLDRLVALLTCFAAMSTSTNPCGPSILSFRRR